ncbi:Cell division control protein 2 [Orobanche hederae]
MALVGVYLWKARAIERKKKGDADALLKILNDQSLKFEFSTVEKTTGGFDEGNELGKGSFRTVYKGVLADGRVIVVKRLYFDTKHRGSEFYNEVNIISSIQHKNLVRLLGCSCSGPENSNKGKTLKWEKRMEIIIGIAEGLVCVHEKSETRIIHRDIKASNILLDYKFRAKIANFGLARSFQDDESDITTVIAGTLGYMAPKYLATGKLTEKADLYSLRCALAGNRDGETE